MRIALIYPPPWKIPGPGEPIDERAGGPPSDYQAGDLDADFFQTPYGLFSLGAQALRAGHQVKIFNLSGFAWTKVEEVIRSLDAELFAMSCWTSNRRGVALVAREIKRHRPDAHVLIGGPHATPFAREMLAHYSEIDTVSVGESEDTFMELVGRLSNDESPAGIPGTYYRVGGEVVAAPGRGAIHDLDALASPHEYFNTHIVMTSRGCPWQCTFCGAETTWGRGFRGQSVPYVLDALEKAVSRLSVKMVQVKDDTFTTNKKRVLELCHGIQERKLRFLWSCDTRVDVLSDDLLREMRLAGCQRLSLGVETGSPRILKNINKRITVEKIEAAATMAKRAGIQVRFYMMLGNRGETAETFRETLEFLARVKPHQYIFSCLTIYPGTEDFQQAEREGWLDRERYFRENFQEFKVPFDATEDVTELLNAWFAKNKGLQDYYREGVAEYESILAYLGDHHAAHLDLGGAHFRARNLDKAEFHVRRALELGTPVPGLALNYLGCIAFARGDIVGMQDQFLAAARLDPQHLVLIENVQAARAWFKAEGPKRGLPLDLVGRHDFQLFERTAQPALPGPLPDDYAEWGAALESPINQAEERSEGIAGSVVDRQRQPIEFRSRRLPVV
ncbi:MAG TPA: radical SAM protein [Polyangiaceae bacterium]|nr:radical SAM protein [Polyangiaceae bacterium]